MSSYTSMSNPVPHRLCALDGNVRPEQTYKNRHLSTLHPRHSIHFPKLQAPQTLSQQQNLSIFHLPSQAQTPATKSQTTPPRCFSPTSSSSSPSSSVAASPPPSPPLVHSPLSPLFNLSTNTSSRHRHPLQTRRSLRAHRQIWQARHRPRPATRQGRRSAGSARSGRDQRSLQS